MPEDTSPINFGRELKKVNAPAWLYSVIFSVVTGLATYAYAAGNKSNQFDQMQRDIAELKLLMEHTNQHLNETDKNVNMLESIQKLHEYRLDENSTMVNKLQSESGPHH